MKPKFKNNYNTDLFPITYEKCFGPSETVQGQSYTIQELLEKFTRGQMPNIAHPVSYTDSDDFDSYDETTRPDFDLADVTEAVETISRKAKSKRTSDITEAKSGMNEQSEAKAKE